LKERYVNQASAMSLSFIFSALNLINQADITYPQVSNKRLHVEMALTKVCLINKALESSPLSG
jgi:DNA polymerase-3 subunit gamma/tau